MESAVFWVEMLCRFDRAQCCVETYFSWACHLLLLVSCLAKLFYPEDGSNIFLWNLGLSPNCMELQPRRVCFSENGRIILDISVCFYCRRYILCAVLWSGLFTKSIVICFQGTARAVLWNDNNYRSYSTKGACLWVVEGHDPRKCHFPVTLLPLEQIPWSK
jgi:hypothetical protein